MNYVPACSILRTDEEGTYKTLAPILILPGMYAGIYKPFLFLLECLLMKGT